MQNGIICAPAGTALFRNGRCWHGGTANDCEHARPMTDAQYPAPWFHAGMSKCVPRQHFERISPRTQQLCRYIAEDC